MEKGLKSSLCSHTHPWSRVCFTLPICQWQPSALAWRMTLFCGFTSSFWAAPAKHKATQNTAFTPMVKHVLTEDTAQISSPSRAPTLGRFLYNISGSSWIVILVRCNQSVTVKPFVSHRHFRKRFGVPLLYGCIQKLNIQKTDTHKLGFAHLHQSRNSWPSENVLFQMNDLSVKYQSH